VIGDGIDPVGDGIDLVDDGIDLVGDGIDLVGDGIDLVGDGIDPVGDGIDLVDDGIDLVGDGINLVDDGIDLVGDGIDLVGDGIDLVSDGNVAQCFAALIFPAVRNHPAAVRSCKKNSNNIMAALRAPLSESVAPSSPKSSRSHVTPSERGIVPFAQKYGPHATHGTEPVS
jgi:hypothetical protein